MNAKLAPRTLFTAASANKALPLVRAIVQDIVDLYGDVRDREQRLNALRRGSTGKTHQDDPYSEEVEQIRNLEALEDLCLNLDALPNEAASDFLARHTVSYRQTRTRRSRNPRRVSTST